MARTAVVVGAGVGGLASAGALGRAGWRVTLLETGVRIRADPAGWFLWPNGVRALRALGLSAGLAAIASPYVANGIRRPDGQWLVAPAGEVRPAATAISAGAPPVAVSREDLHDALIAGLGDVELRTGVTVRQVRYHAGEPAAVSDGKRIWSADLVVAADGVNSLLRRRLDPRTTVVNANCTAWRALVPWYRAPASASDREPASETLGAGYRFQYASLGERGGAGGSSRGGVYWVATVPGADRPETASTQLSLLRRWFADWHKPIGDLLAATEPDDLVPHHVSEVWPVPERFDYPAGGGGFVLLGDAAHAMIHHLGQGACLALEDAATLVKLVGEPSRDDLAPLLAEYARQRRQRAVTVMRQSHRVDTVMRMRGRFAVAARDAALGRWAPQILDRATMMAADWRP
jgi:2-polyprenyl-6-methoxyphenol hydroxylase-like FAD-dependent oxidoreductase